MKRITIKDVAKHAGVSVSTVSNVINGINKCSLEKRELVLAAMNELNYKQNLAAKALVTNKSNLIGIIHKGVERNELLDILEGIEFSLLEYTDYDFIHKEDRGIIYIKEWVNKRNFDGLILIGSYKKEVVEILKNTCRNIVIIDNYDSELEGISYLNSNDTFSSYLATEELIKNGEKKPYLISKKIDEDEFSNRLFLGYISALEDYGISYNEEMHIEVEKDLFLEGQIIAKRLENSCIVSNDEICAGLYRGFYNLNKEKNFEIITFSNLHKRKFFNEKITIVDKLSYKKGREGVEVLFKLINGIYSSKTKNIDSELIKK